MNDIYDRQGWCGLEWLWTTSQEDNFNRPCAAHDLSIEKQLYSQERLDQLFFERIEIYSDSNSIMSFNLKKTFYKLLVQSYRLFGNKLKPL